MAEIGYQTDRTVNTWGSLTSKFTHETNPDVKWPKSNNVYDKMRREDPQVKSVLRAVTLPILRTEWVIDGAGCRPEVVAHVAADLGLSVKGEPFVAPLRTKGRLSFKEVLRLALLELVYGHSFFEQVYTYDENNLAHLAKLAWRPPRTIASIEVARDGGLVGIRQKGVDKLIGVDRLVAFVNEREGANWLGESLLRAAYKMAVLKDRVLRIQALTAERNGLGLPVFTAPPIPEGMPYDEALKWMDEQIARGEEIAKAARSGEAAGAAVAHGASLAFVGVTGKLPDTEGPIRYYDEQIARAVLAHFLNLGTETGSWALGSTFANFFTDSLNAVAQQVADVFNQHVIEDLVDLNWGENEPAPRLVPTAIGEQQPVTAEAIKALLDAGALTKDSALEEFLRAKYGLPVMATDDVGETDTDAERALNAVAAAQKGYLATDKPPLRQEEVRELVRRAGADWLTGDGPDISRIPSSEPEEAA
ncbi:phage portal protein family protein [Microbacterium sp. 2RAF4]|uniref:phage portal protein family protein n=1 Tax=Microbacterium sp. 2RAF4 TaxID=3232999 RepID=UPI003F953F11